MNNKKNIVVLGLAGLFGLIGLIISIVAITQKLEQGKDSQSIKDIFDLVNKNNPDSVKSNANMAYIGSIITIVLSIGLIIFGGIFAFMVFKKGYEANTAIISITSVLAVVIMGLAIGAIVTANHVTDMAWLNKQR